MPYELVLTEEQYQRARRVHERALVIDGSIIVKFESYFFERARQGGVTAVNHSVSRPKKKFIESLLQINECRRWIAANPDNVILALRSDDIRRAKVEGKMAIILGPQDSTLLEDSLTYLDIVYDLGLRILEPTYQTRNLLGDGCGETHDGGLTRYGRDVIKRMNELGIVVDLSHCGWKTSADAIEASRDPVLFTHSHPYSVTPHIRNKSDDLLRAMAAKGGVIGISGFSPIAAVTSGKRPSVVDLVTHVDYVANLVGIDHVGIGLDINENMTRESSGLLHSQHPELYAFTGGGGTFGYDDTRAEGLDSIACFPELTRALVARDYADDDIVKILGGNFLRVLRQVWDRN